MSLMRRTKRCRYERELARLTEASADLADKTMALQELEAVLVRERETAQELGRQVRHMQKDYGGAGGAGLSYPASLLRWR